MNILFYDTETNKLVNNDLPYDHESQPVALQIGAMLYNTELERPLHKVSMLINWPAIEVDEGAARVHGLTPEILKHGVSHDEAMRYLHNVAYYADSCIGFNVGFDRTVVCSSMGKATGLMGTAGAKGAAALLHDKPHYDIMKPLTNVCKIPGRYGYKWPKLTEAYRLLVNPRGFEGAHDAMADIQATFELWQWCIKNNVELADITI